MSGRGVGASFAAAPLALWASAAALAFSLHAGAVAIVLYQPPFDAPSSMEDVGAPIVVEFDALPVAPETEQPDVRQAEAAESAAPAPDVSEKLSAKREDDLPTAEAAPVDAPPDLQLAQEKTLKQQEKPEEDAQTTEAMDAHHEPAAPSSSAQSAAESAPAVAAVDDRAAAPAEGSVAEAVVLPASWQRSVVAHLGRHKRYPQAARAKKIEGEALLRFVIDRAGRIKKASLEKPSGAAILDAEALAMLDRAQPLPPLPANVRAAEVELVVPVNYKLK